MTKTIVAEGRLTTSARARRRGIYRNPVVHRWLRTIHRATALFVGVFIFVIGITGVIIQTERFVGDGSHGGNGPLPSKIHFLIMDLHTAFVFGKPGVVLTSILVTALVYFSVSGIWFYIVLFKVWFKQLKTGVPAKPREPAFSPSPTTWVMRAIHRWISMPVAIYLVFIAISGLGMVPTLWMHGHMPWRTSQSALDNNARAALQKVSLEKGLPLPPQRAPAEGNIQRQVAPVTWMRWLSSPADRTPFQVAFDHVLTRMTWMEPGARGRLAYMADGELPFWDARVGEFFFDLHTGDFYGLPGRIFVLICGIALVAFSVSGFWMYFSMYSIERAKGNKNMLWH
jgi:uncharacterized iron-regulated membrane protein